MYRAPEGGLAFGDILAADWLFDIYLRSDSRAMQRTTGPGGKVVYILRPEPPTENDDRVVAQATMEASDVVMAHGLKRMAIILSDDCELASLAGERSGTEKAWDARNRIVLASLRAADRDKIEAQSALTEDVSLLALEASGGFPGGIVDFNRLFSVSAKSLVRTATPPERVISLDADGRMRIADAWAAHAHRRGPIPFRVGSRKLSQVWTAGGDKAAYLALAKGREWGDRDKGEAAAALQNLLIESWDLGGTVLEHVDGAAERSESADEVLAEVVKSMAAIRDKAAFALQLFEKAGGPPAAPPETAADPSDL